jgi:hypothetical protein
MSSVSNCVMYSMIMIGTVALEMYIHTTTYKITQTQDRFREDTLNLR